MKLASCFLPIMLSAFVPLGQMVFWKIPSDKFLVNSTVSQSCSFCRASRLLDCAVPCFKDKDCFFFCFEPPVCAYQTSVAREGHVASRNPFKDIHNCYLKLEVPGDVKNFSVAANKTVDYSSYIAYHGPWQAVDGNRSRTVALTDSTCTFSMTEEKPWWLVDLEASFAVISVNLTSPDQSLYDIVDSGYLHDLEVRVGDKDYDYFDDSWIERNALCFGYGGSGEAFVLKTCSPLPVIGRIVTVQIVSGCNGKGNCTDHSVHEMTLNTLALCEVDVYGVMLL